MSETSKGDCIFEPEDIENCARQLQEKEADYLNLLFKEKTGYDLPKPRLLGLLFGYIIKGGKMNLMREALQ